MMNGGSGMMSGGMVGFGFLVLILLVLIVLVLVWMFRPSTKHSSRTKSGTASERLDQRLANGDISEEEYDRLKRKINDH